MGRKKATEATKQLTLRVSLETYEKLEKLRDSLKDRVFDVDLSLAAVSALAIKKGIDLLSDPDAHIVRVRHVTRDPIVIDDDQQVVVEDEQGNVSSVEQDEQSSSEPSQSDPS